jgi:hypothetical protein
LTGRKPIDIPKQLGWPTESEHWRGDRPRSVRTNLPILLEPLPEDQVQEIADNAQSREDFHNYNVIMDPPYWGNCTCAIRIICGTECGKYYLKDQDGKEGKTHPEGKNHWAWQIDIAPHRVVCPFAALRARSALGDVQHQACREILIKAPTSEWVLAQHPDDPKNTLAGRVTTDVIWKSKCPRCLGKNVSDKNELLESQMNKINSRLEDQYPSIPNPEGWTKKFYETPVTYHPPPDLKPEAYHPLLEIGQQYAPSQLSSIDPEHIWIDELGITLAQHKTRQIQSEAAQEAELAASAEAAMKMAMKLEEEKQAQDAASKLAAEADKGQQWHHLRPDTWPGLY